MTIKTDTAATSPPASTPDLCNQDRQTITVWSDISCPWATLALHTLHAAAAKRGVELLIDHRAFPLELFNREPTPKPIIDAEIVAIAGLRPELGWRPWPGPESTYPVTMLAALDAVQAAKDPAVGGLHASDQLDTALRHAFFVEGRCLSLIPVILEIAERCNLIDHHALASLLARGEGRAQVFQQWQMASRPEVQGSPQLFTAGGFASHNPGASYHWTARPPRGFPRLDDYRPEWADELLDMLLR